MNNLNSTNMKLNIPSINQNQTWLRNEEYKNWGNLKPCLFKEGKPRILIPNVYVFLYFVLLQAFLLCCFVIDHGEWTSKFAKMLARLCFWLFGNLFFYLLLSVDMGVMSIGDPVINMTEMSQFSSFCIDCKCIRDEKKRHCVGCNVCIQGSYVHLKMSRMCITKKNCFYFCGFCTTIIVQALLLF